MITQTMIDSAMKEYTESAIEIYGNKLKEVILFGSCARGDFENGSDVDIMILLDVPKEDTAKERKKMHSTIHKLDEKYDYQLLFATIVQSYDEFNRYLIASPFYQNVRKDGIRYA